MRARDEMATDDALDDPGAAPLVRSIFFFNSRPALGSTVGLHFFEPRYRILVERALQEPRRACQFVFLPNYADYQASHGDIGYLATIIGHRPVPTGNPNERPRADVQIRFDSLVQVLFHWIEANSGGLCEVLCVPIEYRASLDSVPHVPEVVCNQWRGKDWDAALADTGARLFPSASHGHPQQAHDKASHWLLHATSAHEEARALTIVQDEHPELLEFVYPIRVLCAQAQGSLAAVSSVLWQLGLLYIRHALMGHVGALAPDRDTAQYDAALPTKELRAQLNALQVSAADMAQCVEKGELVELLRSRQRQRLLLEATAAAADRAAVDLAGLPIELACGCPAPLFISGCTFARSQQSGLLQRVKPGSLWGRHHDFVVDERTSATVGQMVASVYDWERRAFGFGDSHSLATRTPALHIPSGTSEADDLPWQIAYTCQIDISSADDAYASLVLTPNLLHMRQSLANATVLSVARALNWSRVRLLFIGHQAAPAANDDSATELTAELTADSVGAPADALLGTPLGCPFARLDHDLLWMIADWLVLRDLADQSCAV